VTATPAELGRLAEKYRTLGELRRARARGEPVPERAVFKALADAHPGSVAELDTLPIEEIDARAAALHEAARGGPSAPWMSWLASFHALFRAALRIRLRSLARRDLDDERACALALDASTHAGIAVDEAFARAVCRPPEGRLAAVVYARLSRDTGEPPAILKRVLFPGSRRLEADG
jgi:hypothetical protein